MNRSMKLLALTVAALLLFGATGCNKLKARDRLNKGVTAFKNVQYETAIKNFSEVLSAACFEIVKAADSFSAFYKGLADPGTKESGAAGYKITSHVFIYGNRREAA